MHCNIVGLPTTDLFTVVGQAAMRRGSAKLDRKEVRRDWQAERGQILHTMCIYKACLSALHIKCQSLPSYGDVFRGWARLYPNTSETVSLDRQQPPNDYNGKHHTKKSFIFATFSKGHKFAKLTNFDVSTWKGIAIDRMPQGERFGNMIIIQSTAVNQSIHCKNFNIKYVTSLLLILYFINIQLYKESHTTLHLTKLQRRHYIIQKLDQRTKNNPREGECYK